MRRLRKIFNISLFLIGFFVLVGNIVYAQQIPHFIKYQGDGKKILEEIEKGKKEKDKGEEKDLYMLTFRIYNIETGGVALWKETHLNVSINKKEKFEVLLGSFTPLDLGFDEDYWLSIEIDSKGELKPRERMSSAGYAYMAEDSYKLGGRLADDFAIMGHSHIGEDIVSPVAEAVNADMVDNIHASNTPTPNQLFSLDSTGKFPGGIISGQVSEALNADTVDGFHADEIRGVKDHGELEGLGDDDHLQYLNDVRGDERYGGVAWDGLTKLETAQLHIADKDNPHFVTLEQLGHIDNNPEEEAPTAAERGEPTGIEIQQWADDITAWGHSDVVINLNADMLDGKHAAELSLAGHGHLFSFSDLTDISPEEAAALNAAGTAGASETNRLATMTDVGAVSGLWTDEGTYIYPNNVGNGLQIMDTGHLAIAGNAGILDNVTANPKGTLTVGQSLAGNNVDYSLVIARHGTPPNPGIYSHTAPALLIQDFSGTVSSTGPDRDGLLRINAYRIGDGTPNAFNATLFNVGNDEGEALRVDGLRNTFIGYGQKHPTSEQIGSLFVNGSVGIGTTDPGVLLHIVASAGEGGDTEAFMVNTPNSEFRLYEDRNTPGWIRLRTTAGNGIILNAAAPSTPLGDYPMLAINASGNVGIGTMNPQGALDVNGAIYQRGAVLHADYVFEPDYKLESIEEHTDYMWQEKHLKAVPKAAKTEEGQEIMEMGSRQRGVLEELEKAHIYIAQLNERLKQVEAKLAEKEK